MANLPARDTDGMLPSYAWPGGYPLVYYDEEWNTLCPECASKEDEYSSPLVAYDTYMEGTDMYCNDCGKAIESAYGDPDESAENVPGVYLDGTQLSYDVLPEPQELDRVQVSFSDAENGYQTEAQEAKPLGWANSAAITLDRKEDSITLTISVGDPRGAFALTVRRTSDGRLVMHVPYPEGAFLHRPLTRLHDGTYQVG